MVIVAGFESQGTRGIEKACHTAETTQDQNVTIVRFDRDTTTEPNDLLNLPRNNLNGILSMDGTDIRGAIVQYLKKIRAADDAREIEA
jgi:hypothetical protein